MISPIEFLWAFIGLLLTIGGTFLEAFVTSPPWIWIQGARPLSLGVTYQVGAVLLIGCLGGKNAASLSQIAYIFLGLTVLPIFSQGGGISYLKEPTFGYLLGFIPGAWVCGWLAFKAAPKLERLALSCVCGLLSVHLIGLSYLMFSHLIRMPATQDLPLIAAVFKYSIYPLPGQLAVVCAVTVLAYLLRRLMFY